tara:strand:- start:1567 stop:2478 length:912 start_codon:yes stop_codon:yes gene_type:complete
MKFAIATDNSEQQSFYCNDGRFYSLSTNQDIGIVDDLYTNAYFSLPLVMNGCYLNLKESTWPDRDFDIILAAIECDIRYLRTLHEIYPDAIIVGQMKETWNHQLHIRNYIIENTNGFVTPYSKINFFKEWGLKLPSQNFVIPSPVNAKYLRNEHNVTKEQKIFDYSNFWAKGRASEHNKDILKNNKLETVFYQSKDPKKFLEHWTPCMFMLNTDVSKGYGLMSIQCACLDTIMIGGNSDSQHILFPDLVGTDVDILSSKLDDLVADKQLQKRTLTFAKEMFEKYYSFRAVEVAIQNMYSKLKG